MVDIYRDYEELSDRYEDLRADRDSLEEQIYTYQDKVEALENEVAMLKEQLRINSQESYYDKGN